MLKGPPPGIEQVIYSQARDTTNCPSCGRYVGPLELCPYCRTFHRRRPIVTFLKYSTPLLAALGLILLYQLGQSIGNPLVKLRDLDQRSNFAYVRLEGEVCGKYKFHLSEGTDDPRDGSLEFCIDDGTRRTEVKSYPDATKRIIRERKVPSMGDHVRVVGAFNAKDFKHYLAVNSPFEIEIVKPPLEGEFTAEEVVWAEQGRLRDNMRVTVAGKVSFVNNSRAKSAFGASLTLWGGERKEPDGKYRYLRVEIPWDKLEMEEKMPLHGMTWPGMPARGAAVRVTGVLKYVSTGKYPGWKLYPAWPSDIEQVGKGGVDE